MKRTAKHYRSSRAFRPMLEQLEARLVPTVTVQHLDLDNDGAADDFRIRGDGENSIVQMFDLGNGLMGLAIDANGDGDFNDAATGGRGPVYHFHHFQEQCRFRHQAQGQ